MLFYLLVGPHCRNGGAPLLMVTERRKRGGVREESKEEAETRKNIMV